MKIGKRILEAIFTVIALALILFLVYLTSLRVINIGTFITIAGIIIFFMILGEIGLFEILVNLFSLIYKSIEPRSTKGKIIVFTISILYGLFVIYIGGGVFALLPFFLHPFGLLYFLISLAIAILGYFIIIFILKRFIN